MVPGNRIVSHVDERCQPTCMARPRFVKQQINEIE